MSGIVNSTGARSGIIGTTVGTPAGGAITGMVSYVWKFKDTSSGTLNIHSTTPTVGTDASSFPAISGRHYLITGMQHISPYRYTGTNLERYQYCAVYWGTVDRGKCDTGSLGTELYNSLMGRALASTTSVNAASYMTFSYNTYFTAVSTEPHYVYTVYASNTSDHQSRAYNSADTPHYTTIWEVIP